MSESAPSARPCSPEQVREAAVWMTLLRGPDRTQNLEQGFARWQAASGANRAAFEVISNAWEQTDALPRGAFPHLSVWQRQGFRQGFLRAGAIVAVLSLLAVAGVLVYLRQAGISTTVGEQRTFVLDDGSRIYLNTDSRVIVDYDEARRHVSLVKGEAMFEVAHRQSSRPFVVTAENRRIEALGTSFVVRREADSVSVTLVEGRVKVSAEEGATGGMAFAGESEPSAEGAQGILLSPGQRVVLSEGRRPELDLPPLDKVVAWRSGHVVFDEVPLAQAVSEMNRYGRVPVQLDGSGLAAIPITGVFRGGDSESFATAVAQTYGLGLERGEGVLRLSGQLPARGKRAEAQAN